MRADRLEHRNHIDRLVAMAARHDGAAIDEHSRPVQTRQRHQAARHVLIAAADGDDAIEPFTTRHHFDGIGDDFARDEGIFHSFGAHGDAIGNSDGVEHDGLAAGRVRAGRGVIGQLIDMHIARRHHAPGGGDADLALREIGVAEPHRVQHGAAGSAVGAIDDNAGVLAGCDGGFGFGLFGCFRAFHGRILFRRFYPRWTISLYYIDSRSQNTP